MYIEILMQMAIDKAREGIAAGQSPFGCAIAIGDRVVGLAHNQVLATTDITAHAEIVALREACGLLGKLHLPRAIVAATCEPCPMCMAALHGARVETVYYGATAADATSLGFSALPIAAKELVRQGKSEVIVVDDVLADKCRALFDEWRGSRDAQTY